MRGFSKGPGLVVGEACRVRVLRELPKGTEIIGKDPPDELFDSLLDGSVTAVGDKRPEGGWFARARLLDASLQSNPRPLLRPYLDKEPGPHVYEVIPRQYLNGWTREESLKPGQECFIWIRPEGNIPWLEREPNQLPSAFPFYPHANLVGFWRARVMAIVKPRGESPVRTL
ncbi:hypothetical protein EBS80_05530, partial [bacterium]|nr:hypothetical protein [bacterium]